MEDAIYYVINKKTCESKKFVNAHHAANLLLGKMINEYFFIKEDREGPRIIVCSRMDPSDLEHHLMMS